MNFILFFNVVLMKILETHIFLAISELGQIRLNLFFPVLTIKIYINYLRLHSKLLKKYFGTLTRFCNRQINRLIISKYCSTVDSMQISI